MKRIPVPLGVAEAHLLRGLLASERIVADVRGDENPWLMPGPGIGGVMGLWICVREADYVKAGRIVAQYLRRRGRRRSAAEELRHPTPTWTCWRCGEPVETQFAVCWKCGEERVNDWV
ncbi:MAG: hypothetical protein JNL94_02375 [Planctomycetes bacterium]|nr:hypothetical protein [Planctomycetota bacterium]